MSGDDDSGFGASKNIGSGHIGAEMRGRDDWVLVCTFQRLILVRRFTLIWEIPLTDIIMESIEIMSDDMSNDVAGIALPPKEEQQFNLKSMTISDSLVCFMHMPRTTYSEDPDNIFRMNMPDMLLECRVIRCGSRTRSRRVLNLLRRRRGVPLLHARRFTDGTDQLTELRSHLNKKGNISKPDSPAPEFLLNPGGGERKEEQVDTLSDGHRHFDHLSTGSRESGNMETQLSVHYSIPSETSSMGAFRSPRRPE